MLYLRNATIEDMNLLFEWANDETTRANSFNTNTISYEEHIRWFNKIMNSDSCYQFILCDDLDPVGQVRFDIIDNIAEISYSISPEKRNLGLGNNIINLAIKELSLVNNRVDTIIAKVKPENMVSKHIFEKALFYRKYECYEYKINRD